MFEVHICGISGDMFRADFVSYSHAHKFVEIALWANGARRAVIYHLDRTHATAEFDGLGQIKWQHFAEIRKA